MKECGRCGGLHNSRGGLCPVCAWRYDTELDWLNDAANEAEAEGVTLGEFVAAAPPDSHDTETFERYWGTLALDQDDIWREC